MRRHRWTLLAALGIVGALPSTISASAVQMAAPRVENAAIITAILVNSSETQAAVDRADAAIKRAYTEKLAIQKRLSTALNAGKMSAQQLQSTKRELANLRSDQERILGKLAAQDRMYQASSRAYREGLTGLLASNDPQVADALRRYSEGDVTALDDLQEVVRLIRRARQAGTAARDA